MKLIKYPIQIRLSYKKEDILYKIISLYMIMSNKNEPIVLIL